MGKLESKKKKTGIKSEQARVAKQALRQAALEIISESGLNRLTLAAVGERAGYSRGLVRYHYGSKDALILAMIDWAIRGGEKIQHQQFNKGLASILKGIDDYSKLLRDNPKALRGYSVLTSEMSYSDNPEFRELLRAYLVNLENNFAAALLEEDLDEADAKAIALVFTASIRGLVQLSVAEPDRDMTSGFDQLKEALRLMVEAKNIVS